jgi:nitrate reductase NapAB chaperone NapD
MTLRLVVEKTEHVEVVIEVATCERCGVLVVVTDTERHDDWHDRVAMRWSL